MKKINCSKLKGVVEKFPGRKILVLGDVMVDRFVWGRVSRISPEAPVPVVKVERETVHLGGAGNVINNLANLGAKCLLAGVVGKDSSGRILKEELKARGVDIEGLCENGDLPTIEKIRIIAGSQQVVRVDKEDTDAVSPGTSKELIGKLRSLVPPMDAVIISDYGKGVISEDVLSNLLFVCRKLKKPVIVDPKIEHFHLYKGVTCITPNLKEAMEGTFVKKVKNEKDINDLGLRVLKNLNAKSVLITRGEHGMSLFEKDGAVTHIPTVAREVFDVTGAGDTVISVFTMAHVCGAALEESAYLSNIAGGIVVGKIGTAAVTRKELLQWLKKV